MKTLKTSIIAAVLTISSLTIAQAQETGKALKTRTKSNQCNEIVSETPITLDHAINTKGAGANDRKKNPDLTKNDATSTSCERLANNKHPDLMKRVSEAVSETVQDESDNKIKPTTTSTKKEYVGHVTLLK